MSPFLLRRRCVHYITVTGLFWQLVTWQHASGGGGQGLAWTVPATTIVTRSPKDRTRTVGSSLFAVKKKRRRKDDSSDSSSGPSDDLPDFDLDEDNESSSKDPFQGEISEAMMGRSSGMPARSVDQLIADRSLESKFEFLEEPTEPLPDLAMVAQEQEMGRTKKAKREQRVAAAMERKEQEQEQVNPLAQIPFLLDDKGQVSGVKVRHILFVGIGASYPHPSNATFSKTLTIIVSTL